MKRLKQLLQGLQTQSPLTVAVEVVLTVVEVEAEVLQ
jgi:hypothetical protein